MSRIMPFTISSCALVYSAGLPRSASLWAMATVVFFSIDPPPVYQFKTLPAEHPVPSVDFLLLLLFFAEPGGGNALGFREKAHPIFPKRMQVSEERPLVARQREDAHRNRNPHVDADHSAMRSLGEF